jgi:hypothetical protein
MSIIHNYLLANGENHLALPSDSTPLSVGEFSNKVIIWILHQRDPEQVRVYDRVFHVVNTGEPFHFGYGTFIGTVHQESGAVRHVFEQLDLT